MSKEAIVAARKHKHEIQAELWGMLVKFTEDTGLVVSSIDVFPVETTSHGDSDRMYGTYEVQVNVTV